MASLPDELWSKILEIGIGNSSLTYKDLCCISIASRHLHRVSSEHSLWNRLLSFDFPLPLSFSLPSSSSSKSLYKFRFERDKERKIAAHNRAVLRKESQISEHSRRLHDIQKLVSQEKIKAIQTSNEFSFLLRVREASVALNVWQPEVVRGRQKQMVEQCGVPAESRIRTLEMELRLCKQQIMGLEKSHRDEKRRLDAAKKELESMKYHPLPENKPVSGGENQHVVKQKKLKSCNGLREKQYKTQ